MSSDAEVAKSIIPAIIEPMLLHDLVLRLSELLNIEDYAGVDNSLNGLQVSRKRQEVDRVGRLVG